MKFSNADKEFLKDAILNYKNSLIEYATVHTESRKSIDEKILHCEDLYKYVSAHPDQSQEAQRQGVWLKDYLVVVDDVDEIEIWTKVQYEIYVKRALSVGACPAVRIITTFNKSDSHLSELPAQPAEEWVAVEKELPKAGYLVMTFNGFSHQILLGSYLNGKWIFHGQERGNITHWRPLPAPPHSNK